MVALSTASPKVDILPKVFSIISLLSGFHYFVVMYLVVTYTEVNNSKLLYYVATTQSGQFYTTVYVFTLLTNVKFVRFGTIGMFTLWLAVTISYLLSADLYYLAVLRLISYIYTRTSQYLRIVL